ncbi:MAG TPA: Spy/CpxP family protein refolding chaperone [Terriglobales bacterium]|nr:Spy/CpxP family protein refolding chaperone [Terriglobales bacterium]
MKSNYWKRILAAFALLLVGALALAQAGPNARGAEEGFPLGHMLGFFTDYLDLTDAQQTQVKAIMAKEEPNISPLLTQLDQTNQQLRQIAENGYDDAKVRSIAAQQSQTLTELTVQKTRIEAELFQVLTPDQKDKLDKFLSRREQRFMKHMHAGTAPQ